MWKIADRRTKSGEPLTSRSLEIKQLRIPAASENLRQSGLTSPKFVIHFSEMELNFTTDAEFRASLIHIHGAIPQGSFGVLNDAVVGVPLSVETVLRELTQARFVAQAEHALTTSFNYDSVLGELVELQTGRLDAINKSASALKLGAKRLDWWATRTETRYAELEQAVSQCFKTLRESLTSDFAYSIPRTGLSPLNTDIDWVPSSTTDVSEWISSTYAKLSRVDDHDKGSLLRLLELFQEVATTHEIVTFVRQKVFEFASVLLNTAARWFKRLHSRRPNRNLVTIQNTWFISVVDHPPHQDTLAIEFPNLGPSARACSIPSIA